MKEGLNNDLISAMKERLLEDKNLATLLMDILSIGKEAAYRRLRGEVPFSFYEVALLAKTMGLSLDEIAGNTVSNGALFSLNMRRDESVLDYIYGICCSHKDIYTYLTDDPDSVVMTASNILPFAYHSHYEMLTKFRLYRWLHQYEERNLPQKMSEITFPEKLTTKLSELSEIIRSVSVTYAIWDTEVFSALIKDVRYFIDLKLLSTREVNQIKKEYTALLKEMEEMAYSGTYANGNKVNLYLSPVPFEASYTFMERMGFQLSVYPLYAIDYIHSQHPEVCQKQKRWIESLKRYSILISQCGERQRLSFFRQQYECLELLKP